MARVSEKLNNFSNELYSSFGFGQSRLLGIFIVTGILSLLALAGFYLPALAALINGLMTLILGGGAFLGISLLTNLSVGGVLFGLVTGIILAALSTTICSLMLFLSPPVAVLLLLPNIIAGISFVLGKISSSVESCFSRKATTIETNKASYKESLATDKASSHSEISPVSKSQEKPGNAFFERRDPSTSVDHSDSVPFVPS